VSLEIRDVVSGYGKIEIIHGVSMRAEKAKIICIIGPNGAGKSTLLKTIFGILKPWKGSILYDEEEITGLRPYTLIKKGISYVLQRRSVFPYLTVEENLRMGAWTIRKNKESAQEAIEENYKRFPILRERRNVRAGSLSGGEQRMLELGRALITRPRLLLLDEFSAGLAPMIARQVYEEAERLKEEEGITIVAVDQNVRQAMKVADYVYVLELGRNKYEGAKEEFETRLRELIKDWLRF